MSRLNIVIFKYVTPVQNLNESANLYTLQDALLMPIGRHGYLLPVAGICGVPCPSLSV
jgi:hypothetical protein